jgi:hypothetical protein
MTRLSSIPKNLLQWLREATRPAALWDGLKTAVWVVPLTVMIWVYAEQQQPVDVQSESILVDISSGSPGRIVTLTHPTDDIPTATLSGAKENLDQVIAKLNEPGDKRWVHIAVPQDLQPGIHDLNIGDEIARADIFTSAGIKVTNVQPARIQVKVDELETREDIPVTAAPNPNLVGTPVFDPPKVKITAPKSSFEDAGKSGSLAFVQIHTTAELAVPGTHTASGLAVLTPLAGDNVTISPPTVTATFSVKQSDRRFKIDSMPIRRSFSAGVPNDVTVDVDGGGTIPNVWVTGPPDEIARIESKQTIPYASLLIDSDDITRGSGSKTLVYNMIEPDVKVEDMNLKVSFTVHHTQ